MWSLAETFKKLGLVFYLPWKAVFAQLRTATPSLAFLGSWKNKIQSPGILEGPEGLSYKRTASCPTLRVGGCDMEIKGCTGNKQAETVACTLPRCARPLRCRQHCLGWGGRGRVCNWPKLWSACRRGAWRSRAESCLLGTEGRKDTQRPENLPLGAEAFSGRKAGGGAD